MAEIHRKVHSRTKKRLLFLKDKECRTCGEKRIKALTIEVDKLNPKQTPPTISCRNCKAVKKRKLYMIHEIEPHLNTKRLWIRIAYLGKVCNTCPEHRRMAIDVVNKNLLRCKNCLRDSKMRKYDTSN